MRYRADISGLRALAVLPAVLYHAEEQLMPGGFVGVDVFFVISGYLITSILAADMAQGDFSLLRFYDRRVRRILPAYVAMALFTFVAVVALLPPGMVAHFGSSLIAASMFLANRHFLAVANYFAPGAAEEPLLHTWSLAVEEQFYLVWPLALFALSHPRLRRVRGPVIFLLLAGSLFLASRSAILRPERAFYQSIPRAWELLMGAVLALGLLPRLTSQRVAEGLAALGLAMVVGSSFFFNAAMPFPGLAALVPTGGALLLIWTGEDGRITRVGRLLSLPVLVGIGLISYSLYLWHWPLFALARLTFVPGSSPLVVALLIAAAFVAAYLSWRFVEQPLRRYGPATRRSEWISIVVGLVVLAILVGLGQWLVKAKGLPGRSDAFARAAQEAVLDRWPATRSCQVGANQWQPLEGCRFGDLAPEAPLVALFGDSFSNHHAPALDQVTRAQGFGLLEVAKAGCSPGVPGPSALQSWTAEAEMCNRFRAAALKKITTDPRIKVVVVAGDWVERHDLPQAMRQLSAAVDELLRAGKGVILVTPTVIFPSGGGRCVMRRRFLHLSDEACGIPATQAAARAADVEAALAHIADRDRRIRLVYMRPAFCNLDRCLPVIDGRVLYADRGHLNVEGSLHFTAAFAAALKSLTAPAN